MNSMSKLAVKVAQISARVRPLTTLRERLCLNAESRINSFIRSRLTGAFAKYYSHNSSKTSRFEPQGLFLRSKIHPYPGLGHQVSVWLAGYLWAADLGLEYLGGTVTNNGGMLKLSDGTLPSSLLTKEVVFVSLPPTDDERKPNSIKVLRGAIKRAQSRHPTAAAIVFTSALDNPRYNQIPAAQAIRQALLSGARGEVISEQELNEGIRIVVHIRRGDVGEASIATGTELSRWVPEDFYADVIRNLRNIPQISEAEVCVVSLGKPQDFPLLGAMDGVSLCLNRTSMDDMADLASADILVAAPSSFSFTAALASNGLVLALHPWWHEIPDEGRWFRLTRTGKFDQHRMQSLLGVRRNTPGLV